METAELLSEEDLKTWLHVKQRARLVAILDEKGIPYMIGGGGTIVTTQTAMNKALVGIEHEGEAITNV